MARDVIDRALLAAQPGLTPAQQAWICNESTSLRQARIAVARLRRNAVSKPVARKPPKPVRAKPQPVKPPKPQACAAKPKRPARKHTCTPGKRDGCASCSARRVAAAVYMRASRARQKITRDGSPSGAPAAATGV